MSALKPRPSHRELNPQGLEPATLDKLCAALAQSAELYQVAARRICAPRMRALFLQRSTDRTSLLRRFQRRHLELTGAPAIRVVGTAVAPSEQLGRDEASVVDGLERHDLGVRGVLAAADAAGGLSRTTEALVRSTIATITADHREVRDLNLILH